MKGTRRPSHTLINQLMKILGDEVQILFLSHYIEVRAPKLIEADKFIQDKTAKDIEEMYKDLKRRKKDRVYT